MWSVCVKPVCLHSVSGNMCRRRGILVFESLAFPHPDTAFLHPAVLLPAPQPHPAELSVGLAFERNSRTATGWWLSHLADAFSCCLSPLSTALGPLFLPHYQDAGHLLLGQPYQPLKWAPCLLYWSLVTHLLFLHSAARKTFLSHKSYHMSSLFKHSDVSYCVQVWTV